MENCSEYMHLDLELIELELKQFSNNDTKLDYLKELVPIAERVYQHVNKILTIIEEHIEK
jgi:hypothetical protein